MISLRPAQASDLDFLMALRIQTMSAHLQNSGIEIALDEQKRRVLHRLDCAQIVNLDGVDCGLLKVSRDTEPWKLIQIQIAASAQGRGLGEKLIRQVLLDARQQGVAVELSVLKNNPARALYERLGFRLCGEDEFEYWLRIEH